MHLLACLFDFSNNELRNHVCPPGSAIPSSRPVLDSQRNPMNARDPVEGYEEHLEPLIQGAREARLDAETVGVGGPRPRAKL